jgi:sec-independent protein translocase protein TatB
MFDIGGFELLLIAVVGLLVIGPERLPETLRTLGLWLGRLRRSFTAVKTEIEKEIGMDEVKRQLHNEAVMEEMQRIEREVKGSVDEARIDPGAVTGKPPAPQTNQHTDAAAETAAQNPDADTPPAPVLPPTEAELEAAYERKVRDQQSAAEDKP